MGNKLTFEEPLLEVMRFGVEDIITSSTDWAGGAVGIDIPSIDKP